MAKVPRAPSLRRLASLAAEVATIDAGEVVWRVYFRGGRHPARWQDFRHVGPLDARFDHLEGDEPALQRFAVLYAAVDPVTCLAEVFQRRRVINRWADEPWLVAFELSRAVPLLDLSGTFPTRAGASMGLMTGPRSVSRNWARAFHAAYPDLVGIYYPSSMHANRGAIALSERAEEMGVLPDRPSFHRALGDPAILSLLKNAARTLGFALN